MFSLDSKVVIITGACGLLGVNHSHAVASAGAIPILIDIKAKELGKLKEEIMKKYNIVSMYIKADITKEKQIREATKIIIKKYGKIDCLINNAANNPKVEESEENTFSRLETFNLKKWQEDINVGLTGAFICAKYFGNEIAKNKKGGVIINISSDLGLIAPDQRLYIKINKALKKQSVKPVTYSVVKHGIIGLTKYISTYWTHENVRCNVLCPGPIENNQPKSFIERIINNIPLKRMAQANEYQSTLIWMLSDETSYLNGAVIPVDGGKTAW